MAKKQTTDVKEKSVAALTADVIAAKEALFVLEQDNNMRKLKNTRSIFLKRKEIAKMLTVIQLKNMTDKKEVKNA